MARKISFTLIEVLLSLGLLIFLGSAVLIKGHSLLMSHRIESEVSKLVSELRHVQAVARSLQSDITLSLASHGNGVALWLTTDEPLTPQLQALIPKKPLVYPCLKWEGEPQLFNFTSSGYIAPQKEIELLTQDGKTLYKIKIELGSDFIAKKESIS